MISTSRPVTVIVPVYRNLDVSRACIASVLASDVGPRKRLLVIDDASPESALRDWLTGEAAAGEFELLRNESNLGFVATVNRGIRHAAGDDIVLLNSDTEVANHWLTRLQSCAYSTDDAGTATPLSNNASICSYPLPLADNPLPDGWSLQALDELAARENPGRYPQLPVAVGFCMYIRRDCLDEVGLFDEEHFGIGYGEECDFSMRARAAGWRHLLAADTFVYHRGGQSFGTQTESRIAEAEQTLHRLHPDYHPLATRFIDEDPLRTVRDPLDSARAARSPADARAVIDELRIYRDHRVEQKTNRERALEHALDELRSRDTRWRYAIHAINRLDPLHQRFLSRRSRW